MPVMFERLGLFWGELTCFRLFHQLGHLFTVAWVKLDFQNGFCDGTGPIRCIGPKYSVQNGGFTGF